MGEPNHYPDYIRNLSEETYDVSSDNPYADAYGMLLYKFHRTKVDYLFVFGNGGNHLIVIPEKEMVIALTSIAYGQGYGHRRSYNIMSKILAPFE